MASKIDLHTCKRYRRNGDPCGNLTNRVEQWCHEPDCDGFTRPHAEQDPGRIDRAPLGTAKHIAMTQGVALDVEVDEVNAVSVTRKARDQFVNKHGGTDRAAEGQIRQVLEDFVLEGARFTTPSGYVKLSRDGYWIVLSPDHGTITAYDTVHRERNWEQFKAGVPSRFKVHKPLQDRLLAGPAAFSGPAVPLNDSIAAIRPAEMHVMWRALRSYSKVRSIDSTDLESISEALREELGEALPSACLLAAATSTS